MSSKELFKSEYIFYTPSSKELFKSEYIFYTPSVNNC